MNPLYKFVVLAFKAIQRVFTGKMVVQNKEIIENLDANFILVSPHRAFIDPFIYAADHYPNEYAFIAKKEFSKNPILKFLFDRIEVIFVDRDRPGPSVIREPVKLLKEGHYDLMIFPSGTRHSEDLKGGASVIARLSKKPLVPAVFVGPVSFWKFISRQNYIIRYGEPIWIDGKDDEKDTQRIEDAFQQLYTEIEIETGRKFGQ